MPAMTTQTTGDINALFDEIVTEGLALEPRCRICRNDTARQQVNTMLAQGHPYTAILRALEGHNEHLPKRDRVTIDSIRNHTQRHFPVQNTAHAAYREILERRAKDNGTDFISATGTAVTALAYLETLMVRGYQALIDENTVVTPMEGMKAALKLHELRHRDANPAVEIDRMRGELDRIIAAIREVVPEALWQQILDKLDDEHGHPDPGRQ